MLQRIAWGEGGPHVSAASTSFFNAWLGSAVLPGSDEASESNLDIKLPIAKSIK